MADKVSDIIEEVKNEICKNYCKYEDMPLTEMERDKITDEICGGKCPLNRL